MKDRIDFNITNKGISVGASVTRDYFDERVLPLITSLLADMSPSQKRRFAAASRAMNPAAKPKPASVPKTKALAPRPAVPADVTPAAAIRSYSPRPANKTNGTAILA
ncbi:hypothetical protein [Devosia sp. A449]